MRPVTAVFSPLDRRLQLTPHLWSRRTIEDALRLGTEIASYARAAQCFTAVSGIALSRSALQRLALEYGGTLVAAQAAEARAMVEVPRQPGGQEEVVWRERVTPDSAVMAVSSDGVLIHVRDEGWKEVKAVSVSALLPAVERRQGEPGAILGRHSYRAGLWDATTFTGHHWAEACRRGVDQAQRVLCISDGAAWIWAVVFMCFAVRIEILDFWHAVQRLWTMAQHATVTPEAAAAWVAQQKRALAHSHLRQVLQAVRRLYPRGQALPEPVRQAVGYLVHNRRRMEYATYRAAGYPIGSGTIESACKTVVQARMKQAGMRWSRPGAQAMLALRSLLLSNRWHELSTLHPPA